jgi:membrane associated rhomboid family serine protease
LTPVTSALIALNVLVFLWEIASGAVSLGGFTTDSAIARAGAVSHDLVLDRGEWWRVISAAFLHGGLMHVAFNMFALAQLGTFIERLTGSRRMFAIYAISLIGAGLAVVCFGGDAPTVGASGAIYGLFGALIAIGLRLGREGRALTSATLPILLINLVLTFTIPMISIAGHLGGLVSGFAVGLALQRRPALVAREEPVAASVLQSGEVLHHAEAIERGAGAGDAARVRLSAGEAPPAEPHH